MLEITSNGSKWYGEEQDTIDKLLEVLAVEPLDRSFENFGNFIYKPFTWKYGRGNYIVNDKPMYPDNPGALNFFGNFLRVSHVFNITTDDKAIIAKLGKAIRANQKRSDYLSQDKPKRTP